MSKQLGLFGVEGRHLGPAKRRIFFALLPDSDAAERISDLAECTKAALRMRGDLIKPEHLHVTLQHLGDHPAFPEDVVALAMKVGQAFQSKPFQFSFDLIMSFNNAKDKKPLVLTTHRPNEDLMHLRRNLGAEMIKGGLKTFVDRQAFKPHCTMLYDVKISAEIETDTMEWQAKELVLIESYLGETKHVHLARWPLQPNAV